MTFRQIGETMGLSRGCVRELCRQAEQKREALKDPRFAKLSLRVAGLLERMNLKTKAEVAEAIRNGKLTPKRTRRYGRGSHAVLCRWAGVTKGKGS
jgi:hypothetical protein